MHGVRSPRFPQFARNSLAIALTLALMPVAMSSAVAQQTDDEIEIIEIAGERTNKRVTSPKDGTIRGVFGGDKSLLEIPRSVTPISADMMSENSINDLHDILKLVPNTYAASGFGAPSLPTIRGQLGELFQAGMRRQAGNNGFGVPLSFNGTEQIDVVKGVPSVVLGSTQRVGGFVNLQPKRAPLTGQKSSVTLSAGRWDAYSAQLDVGTALQDDESGVRVSVESRREGSFFDYTHYDSDNVFLSYRLLPSATSEWNISGEFYEVDYTDNAGINRPTQRLIDDGFYIQGQGVQPNDSTVPGPFAVVSPTGEVKLPRNRVHTDPENTNTAQTYLLHSVYENDLSSDLSFVNRTYFQQLQKDAVATNSFVEIIDSAKTFENRSEWLYSWSEEQKTTAGFNLRYNDVLGVSQFSTEADLPVDLTGPLSNRRIPLTAAQQERLVEYRPGLYVSPGGQYDIDGDGAGDFNLSDTTDSKSWQVGVFAQQESQLTDRLLLTTGVRVDWYDVTARDALPPEGVTRAEDSINKWLTSGGVSLNYNWSADWLAYVTANYSESTSNSMAGGTVLGADNQISELNFATENELYELGVKYAPASSPWYADAAIFQQTRSLRNRDGSNTGIITRGFETQAFYQNTSGLWASVGYSYLDARYDDSASSQDSRQVADAFDNSRPDLIEGTGVGAPNFPGFAPSNASVQGLPDHTFSAALGYNLTENWSVGIDGVYTGDYKLDFLDTVRIRDQHLINVNSRYAFNAGRSSLRLDIFNVTDQDNWAPVFEGGYFGSSLVFPELPMHAEITFTHAF